MLRSNLHSSSTFRTVGVACPELVEGQAAEGERADVGINFA
jgi:hypothetical protein